MGVTTVTNDVQVAFLADRKSGLSYQGIAEKHGTTKQVVRYWCGKALKAGLVTAEEIYWRAVNQPQRFTPAEYDDQWVKRVVQRCMVADSGCWVWQGQLTSGMGYGQTTYRSKNLSIHRKMYEITRRVVLERTQYVCHACDTPACCNPAHLQLGNHRSNLLDCVAKGRNYEARRTECEHGHPFDEQNTVVRKATAGGLRRVCRTCERIRHSSPEYIEWRRNYQRQRRAEKRRALMEAS